MVTLLSYPKKDDIVRIQRRKNFRVPCHLVVRIQPHETTQIAPFETHTIDLSAGGLAYDANHPLPEATILNWSLTLPMPEGQVLQPSGTARVVRVEPSPKDPSLLRHSIEFQNLMPADEEAIVQYCFNRQRKIRHTTL
nr:PilZ domain-containing protein [Caldalkalibacillus salinus]